MLVIGLVLVKLASRARASVRHLLLAATFATVLAIPLVVLSAPEVLIGIPVPDGADVVTAAEVIATSAAVAQPSSGTASSTVSETFTGWQAPSWITMFRLIWIAGLVLLLGRLAIDMLRLYRIRRDGLPWREGRELAQDLNIQSGVGRDVEILLHENIAAPVTFGLRRSVILLPPEAREWSEADLSRAIVHEIEHVRRGDWGIQLAARAICAFYWFHPLVWLALRRLNLEAERTCDDAVVQSAERTEYADQLVSLARQLKAQAHPAPGMANRSDLAKRVSALLDGDQRRGRSGFLAATGVFSIACLIVLAIAPVRAVTQPSSSAYQSQQTPEPQVQEAEFRVKVSAKQITSRLDWKLFEASEEGRISVMEELIAAGANVNAAINGDGSPLIAAAREGRLEAVKFLLDRGATPDLAVPGDGSPLILAANRGHIEVVSVLLDRGADIDLGVPGDGNPLIMAASSGHTEIVSLLLDRGANLEQIVPGDENPLIKACESGQLRAVKLLVSRGANVNARVQAGRSGTVEWRTPLNMAQRGGHKEIVEFLFASGARE
jgi:beta-lactamase regulating signal transducer with metallopeptidase domain